MLLLRPDPATNGAFLYCLLEAALRFHIDLIATCAMSNHHHTVIYDREGRYPEFIEHFHKMFARSQNALRRRQENCWSSAQASVVRLLDRDAVIEKIVYTATNPVKDNLVSRAHHWPGANSLVALSEKRSVTALRPRHFFRDGGPMPASVTLKFAIPPELGDEDAILAQIRERVVAVELDHEQDRLRAGRRVLGRRGVLRQAWTTVPTTETRHRGIVPRFATKDATARLAATFEERAFVVDYRAARQRWIENREAVFPAGTYWLRRFAGVQTASETGSPPGAARQTTPDAPS